MTDLRRCSPPAKVHHPWNAARQTKRPAAAVGDWPPPQGTKFIM